MFRELIGKIWKMLPGAARTSLVRTTQTTFTVSVTAIIINEKQEVLLLDHVIRPRSGWGFPGGFLDSGEQAADAIRREVKEETSLELEALKFCRISVRGRHVEIVFSARPVGEATVQSPEIYRLGWFEIESLPAGTTSGQKMLIREVLDGYI